MILRRNTALRNDVVCSIALVIRNLPDAAAEWKGKEAVREQETLKEKERKNASIILRLAQNKARKEGGGNILEPEEGPHCDGGGEGGEKRKGEKQTFSQRWC